jgi:hypothetical protein
VTHGHTVGFRLGAYDRSLPLVIDPVLVFSTFLAGCGKSKPELGNQNISP